MRTLGKTHEIYPSKLLDTRIRSNFITIPQTTINYKELHNKLVAYKQIKYCITKLEQHKDQGYHIHIVLKTKQQVCLRSIHNIILNTPGDIKGTINYQKPLKINATIQYLKKELTEVQDSPYLEDGDRPLDSGITKNSQQRKDDKDKYLLEALELASNGETDDALEHIRQTNPRDYLLYKNTIKDTLQCENKLQKKWKKDDVSIANVKLTEKQQQVWDLLQIRPKARTIIWVTGQYGSGKSFLYNYIKRNYEYRMYDAGQSASLDNVAHGYDEEGVIAWDLPRCYDFNEKGNTIATVMEKFSDFSNTVTSKKYNGKTQDILGHVLVFSNHPPLQQLAHRNIVHIDLSQQKKEHQFSDSEDDSEDSHSYIDNIQIESETEAEIYNSLGEGETTDIEEDTIEHKVKQKKKELLDKEPIQILSYLNGGYYLKHPHKPFNKAFKEKHQIKQFIINNQIDVPRKYKDIHGITIKPLG